MPKKKGKSGIPKTSGMPTVQVTKTEKEAWIKAGMPNLAKFLKEYRQK